MTLTSYNYFNIKYYNRVLEAALEVGYQFVTLQHFITMGCPDGLYFIIRHDIDRQPMSLQPIIESEHQLGIKSTIFVRLAGAEYNALSYSCFKQLMLAVSFDMEIGLHTNFIEFATINNLEPIKVLEGELRMIRSFFNVSGIAPHRDINYLHNSLPWIEEHWEEISSTFKLDYHAYEQRILSKTTYVNEGFNPHLCWRNPPEHAIKSKQSIYMLTHPHWWFKDHPFETP